MVVLVACGNQAINEHFSVRIVGEGIEPHNAKNKLELLSKLENKDIDVIILDIESSEYGGQKIIKEIKINHNMIPIIVLTYKTGMAFAKQMSETGVHGFVSKTENFNTQINKTLILLDSIKSRRKEKRKYMRIEPDEAQLNRFSMHISGLNKNYTGKVRDISLGGIAVVMSDNVTDSILYPGITVNVEFSLNKMSATSSAKVVARRGNEIAVSFRDMPSVTRIKISEYILSSIG